MGAGALVLAAVIVFVLVYFLLFPTSSPKPFSLTTAGGISTTATSATSTATGSPAGEPAGTWTIGSGSQAGYRVREKLVFLPAQSDAVGRTSQISGNATLTSRAGTLTISRAAFTIAVNTLKSDRSQRDEKIHEIGLESSRYPTATFAQSQALQVALASVEDRVAHTTVTGIVEIHGVSKRERIPVELTLRGGTLEAAGALTFPWEEFGMSAPSVGGFVSVTGKATMEFDLRLRRA